MRLSKKQSKFKVIYQFEKMPNWQEKLSSVYELIFRKVEQMEIKKYENRKYVKV